MSVHSLRFRHLLVSVILGASMISIFEIPVINAAEYRVDPKIRRKNAREYLTSALMGNAAVTAMLLQGSDDRSRMEKMLTKAYGDYMRAIGALEGLNREAKFQDPLVDQAVSLLYQSKGITMQAEGAAKAGNSQEAMDLLAQAKMMTKKAEALSGI